MQNFCLLKNVKIITLKGCKSPLRVHFFDGFVCTDYGSMGLNMTAVCVLCKVVINDSFLLRHKNSVLDEPPPPPLPSGQY